MAAAVLAIAALAAASWRPSIAEAQIPAELVRRRIGSVRVTGETSGATSARDIGIPLGAPLTRRLLRSTVRTLLETGRWAEVQIDAVPEGTGVALVVFLRPRVVVTRIEVVDNEVLDDEDVRLALGIPAGGTLEHANLDELGALVTEAYAERGYVEASVRLVLRDTDDPTRKVLRVLIDEREPLRVARYVYEGQEPPRDIDLPEALGVDEGDVLDWTRLREGLREARRMLRRQGFLESRIGEPRVEREGLVASLIVPVRFGWRYEIRITGHEPLERSTVEDVLELENTRLGRRTLEALTGRVRSLFQRHGFHRAEVVVERTRGPREGTAILNVRVTAGRPLAVVGMSFPGAVHFDSDYLQDQVISVLEEDLPDTRVFAPVDSDNIDRLGMGGRSVVPERRQLPAPLAVDPGRVFYGPLYERALEHLTEVYRAAGFLSAHLGPYRLERVGRGRAVVVLPVYEGPRTLLFRVSITGAHALGDRELLEEARLARGEPFSYLGLEEAIERMTDLYREEGYLYARIEPTVRFSEDRERAEVVLEVVERFMVRFGEIAVEGNTRTDAALIRDVVRARTGELFRPSVLRSSQDALMALGIFTSVNIGPRDPELAERVKPITVRVQERDPQYIDGQLGVSTGQGLRGTAEYGYRNIGGTGITFTARAQLAFQFLFQDEELERNISGLPILDRLERRINVTLGIPHIPGIPNVRTTLDLVHVRDNQRVFGLDKWGGVLSFTWQPIAPLTVTLSGELAYNNLTLFGDRDFQDLLEDPSTDPQTRRLLRVPEGETVVASTRLAVSLDQRDNAFVPTEGWFVSGSVEWARTVDLASFPGPRERFFGHFDDVFFSHFLKLSGTLNGYIPIDDVVLAGQLRVGGIVHLEPGSLTYPNRQFFLGGVNTLRGFNQDQLQPQDVAESLIEEGLQRATVIQGGDFFYLLRIELRFPIFESIQGGVFADLGNHWADTSFIDFSGDCVAQPARCFVRPTVGLGVRLATPVGPLALDYGFNLVQREELSEPFGALHFSIGVF